MATWAPNVSKRTPYAARPPKSRAGNKIVGCIPHIGANAKGSTVAGYVAKENSRNSHPNYVIQVDGTVIGVVHPDQRPTSTGGSIDLSAVTVEMDNTEYGHPWPVSQAQLDALAIIIRHHADESPRRGKKIVKNDPHATQEGFFVGWHAQYHAVTCPGPFVLKKLDSVIAKANSKNPSKPSKPSTPSKPATTPPKAPAGRRKLAVGVGKGNDIGKLQAWLKATYPSYAGHLVVDDVYGNQTAGVIKEFQDRSDLVVDGVVGLEQTWPALIKAGFKP